MIPTIPSDQDVPKMRDAFLVAFGDFNDAMNWAIRLVRREGYRIVAAESADTPKHETPSQFQQRLGISRMTFMRRISHPNCPPFICVSGPTGRITTLVSTRQLESWMKRRQ